MIEDKLKDIIGEEVIIGFGSNNERLVLLCGKEGMTLYTSNKGIEVGENEKITTKIIPLGIKCERYLVIKNLRLSLQLGKHRFLTAVYCNDNKGINLHVIYLPDEKDLKYNTSEFMNKCGNRGLM